MKYVSELKELNGKVFDTVEALEKAEADVNKEIAKKQELVAKRKADAAIVDEAIKNEVEVKRDVRERRNKLAKEYMEEKRKLDKKYFTDNEALNQEIEEAGKKVTEALQNFCKEHPEGYHSTIKFDDGSTQTFSYKYTGDKTSLSEFIDAMFKPFWF